MFSSVEDWPAANTYVLIDSLKISLFPIDFSPSDKLYSVSRLSFLSFALFFSKVYSLVSGIAYNDFIN